MKFQWSTFFTCEKANMRYYYMQWMITKIDSDVLLTTVNCVVRTICSMKQIATPVNCFMTCGDELWPQ